MRKIKGILITPNQEGTKPRVHELEYNSYKDFYPLLECDTFEIPSRKFNGKWLDIYCDEEGRYKKNKPSIITKHNGQVVEIIWGNVFIVSNDGNGNTISLTDEEIEAVLKTQGWSVKGECEVCVAEI